MKKKYRVGIYEETAGYIVVEAENAQEAEEVGDELLNEYGCDKLFYPEWNADGIVIGNSFYLFVFQANVWNPILIIPTIR